MGDSHNSDGASTVSPIPTEAASHNGSVDRVGGGGRDDDGHCRGGKDDRSSASSRVGRNDGVVGDPDDDVDRPVRRRDRDDGDGDDGDGDGQGARRLLALTYRDFRPVELGDRYVAFLLRDDGSRDRLQRLVASDHAPRAAAARGDGGGGDDGVDFEDTADGGGDSSDNDGNGGRGKRTDGRSSKAAPASIEIDAFRLLSTDPVLGNLTLRYPDTLLDLLADSTVQARRVIRRRMEVALRRALGKMKRSKSDMTVPNRVYSDEVERMRRLHRALKSSAESYDPVPLRARLVHLPPVSQFCKPTLSSLTSGDVGTVVQVSGTCVRVGPVRMMETSRTYRCLGRGCGREFAVSADFGTANNALPAPAICPMSAATPDDMMDDDEEGGGCRSTSFAVVQSASVRADYQEIKVQESASALSRVGSVPRSLLVKLSDDLVDSCNPGDDVVVVGCLHAEWSNDPSALGPGAEVMVGMCMSAHSVRVVNVDEEFASSGAAAAGVDDGADRGGRRPGGRRAGATTSSGNLREKFRREFEAFWSDGGSIRHPLGARDYIVRAVCPKLYGMHAVKLGLLLVLIGGANVPSLSAPDDGGGVEGGVGGDGEEKQEGQREHAGSDDEAPVAFDIGCDGDICDDGDDDVGMANQKKRSTTTGQRKRRSRGAARPSRSRRRVQSHILLIGDPGTGKSQFLRFAAALSPRSVLTTGTGSSSAGLTCAAVRDSGAGGSSNGGKEFSLEAGALALADRGVCCIDEFGCMSKEDRTAIHEAMEQQTISVAKAGIVCKLNARATVVAVMNPSGGIYKPEETLARNSRLGAPLLSRFDLIFVMLDQAVGRQDSISRDVNIAHFLLQQSIMPGSGYERPREIESTLLEEDNATGHWGLEKLRAYIATIREKFKPTLTAEASDLLQKHFRLCREQNDKSLVTLRFLESMIRLSQAHARLMYRDKVLLDDAVAVILLMECTAAAPGGGVFGNGVGYGFDDGLNKNPIDTEFRPFNAADRIFEEEKAILLERYAGNSGNNSRQENGWDNYHQTREMRQRPSYGDIEQQGQQTDQWGRMTMTQNMSQAPSPQPWNIEQGQSQFTPAMVSSGHCDQDQHGHQNLPHGTPCTISHQASAHPPTSSNVNPHEQLPSSQIHQAEMRPGRNHFQNDCYENVAARDEYHDPGADPSARPAKDHGSSDKKRKKRRSPD